MAPNYAAGGHLVLSGQARIHHFESPAARIRGTRCHRWGCWPSLMATGCDAAKPESTTEPLSPLGWSWGGLSHADKVDGPEHPEPREQGNAQHQQDGAVAFEHGPLAPQQHGQH